MITSHYRTDNIYGVMEWGTRWLRDHADLEGTRYWDIVSDLTDWCGRWLENDPRDNGGDGTWRRRYGRSEWPGVYADYEKILRLSS